MADLCLYKVLCIFARPFLECLTGQDNVLEKNDTKARAGKKLLASTIMLPPPFQIPCICVNPDLQESSAGEAIKADSTT